MRLLATGMASVVALILTIPILVLAAPFLFMSSTVRWFARATEPEVAPASSLMRFDPLLGWRPSANLDTHYVVKRADVYPLVTDSEGWPGRLRIEDSEVVVVGDSFAYGYCAQKGESFIDLLPERKIKALASPGYDMVQETLLLREHAPQLKGKLVLWWIYLENDLPDNILPEVRGYRKPFVRKSKETGEWEIVTSHVRDEKWRHTIRSSSMEVFSHLCAPTPIAERHYAACNHLIAEVASTCRSHKIPLVIMTIPTKNQLSTLGHRRLLAYGVDKSSFDPRYPDRRIGEMCANHGVWFVSLMETLQDGDYNQHEGFHWNSSGHAKAATAIRQVCQAWESGALTP
jgi:hypothetical protein